MEGKKQGQKAACGRIKKGIISKSHNLTGLIQRGLDKLGFEHKTVNHGAGQYSDGDCHVNTLEGFWARLKLSIRGTHVHVSGKYLERYVKEFEYRYNRRREPYLIFADLIANL